MLETRERDTSTEVKSNWKDRVGMGQAQIGNGERQEPNDSLSVGWSALDRDWW